MSISSLDAASAYNRVLGAASAPSSTPDDTAAASPAASFGGMVESLVGEASGSLRQAETASAKQVAGKGDLVDVVTAIGAAETALNTVVAVRDRVVSAYTEIMHMQI
ncbi:flagellar hook-basal body complex protein FliE [Sphingomonas sp. PR090111-T3T-6A]|uniref:flagellar hook-basal body complex protein FliE n=1 Tax=Sphingomonas sp. PR090111-T3T-6A TaxID=685778 RepID=UPI00035D30C7|nr:flagellar hook-basal body complex protein FliE [Sphingomonas sp. PR090111-T3T-6A]